MLSNQGEDSLSRNSTSGGAVGQVSSSTPPPHHHHHETHHQGQQTLKKSISLDSIQLTSSSSSESDNSDHEEGSPRVVSWSLYPPNKISPRRRGDNLEDFVKQSNNMNNNRISSVDSSSDTLSVYGGGVPLYLPSTSTESDRRELKYLKYKRRYKSPKPNEVRNKTTDQLIRLGYSMRKENIKRSIKEIAKHPGKTIENIQAKNVKKSLISFIKYLPHIIIYFFVIIIYFRDVILNYFRFSQWPSVIFIPFMLVIGIQIHAWVVWFKEVLNIVIFYNLISFAILGCAILYFGDWILVHLFPKYTAQALDGHILETTLTKFYSVPVTHSFDIPMFSLMPFYNKTTPIYLKKLRQKAEMTGYVSYAIDQNNISAEEKDELLDDKDLKRFKRKLLYDKQHQYPFDLFRKIGKLVTIKKKGKISISDEELLERITKLAERGMRDLGDTDYGSDLMKQITPYRDWFPIHKNCRLTLYHDAHHSLNGRNAFEDMYDAIENAKQLVYITGWSINPHIRLKRDAPEDSKEARTLGQLLIDKANEGVSVNIILWNETGSTISSNMDTNDGETIQYFQNTRVVAVLSRRSGYTGLIFSHHQKTLICDKFIPEKNKRTVIAFSKFHIQ